MIWKPEIGLGDVLTLLALLAALIGLLFTYLQIKQVVTTARAEFVKSLVTGFYGDQSIYEAFYKIDCSLLDVDKIMNWTKEDAVSSKEAEKGIDYLLTYLDMVARLVKLKVITREDAKILEYEFLIVAKSSEVKKYLEYLSRLYDRKIHGIKPHPYFQEFASMLEQRNLSDVTKQMGINKSISQK